MISAAPTSLRAIANRPSTQPTSTTTVPLGASLDSLNLSAQGRGDYRRGNGGWDDGRYNNGYDNDRYDNGRYDNGGYDNDRRDNDGYDDGRYNNGGYDNGGYDNGRYDRGRNDNGGILGFIGRLLGGIVGGYNGGYTPWPAPVNNGGYIPPETAYDAQISSLLNQYDRRQQQLGYMKDRGLPNQEYAREERALWQQTCESIVDSWAPRDQKLGALGHVLNSSTMYYSDFQQYANRIGGVPQPYYPGY